MAGCYASAVLDAYRARLSSVPAPRSPGGPVFTHIAVTQAVMALNSTGTADSSAALVVPDGSGGGAAPKGIFMPDPARPLRWTDAMVTGIDTVDEQHQRLLEIFNRIALAQTDASHETVRACLDELIEYTRYHFREEERLIHHWQVDSKHRTMHLQAHESFRGFLRQAQVFSGEHAPEMTVELLAFLAQWLLHHIMGMDRRMAREIHRLQAGGALDDVALAPVHDAGDEVADTVNRFMEHMGRQTFGLLGQRQQLLELQALYRMSLQCDEVLRQSRQEQEMLQGICAKLVQDTTFHAAWIGKPSQLNVFDVLALAGDGAEQLRTAAPESADPETASVAGKAWNTQQRVVCNDTLADPTLQSWHTRLAERRWCSMLAIPIMRAGQMWAILLLASPRRGCFDAPTIAACSRIVTLLGHGLDELDVKSRAQARQAQDARMARSDTLTGLPNRLAIEEYLPQAIARARHRGSLLAVGVIDLDDFKPINDRLGHEAGDELLRSIARGLLEGLRDTDFIGRLDGDEFVVILENLEATQLMSQLSSALQRLHRAVEAPSKLTIGEVVAIDMAMGVAVYPKDGNEPKSLLRQADAAMYQVKQIKGERAQWWQIGMTVPPEQIAETSLDAFGPEAQELMRSLTPHLQGVAEKFSASFYRELRAHPESAAILACLSDAEYHDLARKQASHLRFLLDARTTEQSLAQTAHRLGVAHALIGISSAWMTRAMGLYRDLLRTHLNASPLTARMRYRTLQTADVRLQLDIESQLQAMQSIVDQYQMLLACPTDGRAPAMDCAEAELNALAALPGIRAAVVWRPDVHNRLDIERAAGDDVGTLLEEFRARDLRPMLDRRDVRGQGLVATTWMTECQQETSAFAHESRSLPWQALMQGFGIRSAVTLPVRRHGAIHAVLMLFGAYPNQFASGWMHTWRLSLQNRWDLMTAATHNSRQTIETGESARIRSLLYGGGVEMFVQPIVNLTDGALLKVEALARLRAPDGTTLVPGQFLPALGETDLDALFRQGLMQGLGHVRRWRDEKLDINLSINLAPSSLVHPDCAYWIEGALREAQVAPQHLTLELLESQALDASAVDQALTRLASAGVKIALDDFGVGFSNLKRLAELPFDVIKIDQNLVKDLTHDPIKALSLIRTAVQIGHDLGRDVVAEGLEDAGIIEAACQLGCRLGQGYGLARPMPAAALADWIRIQPFRGSAGGGLRSWIGALAYQWMMMHDTLCVRLPGEISSCSITEFLEAQEIHDRQVLQWHWQIHEDPVEAVRLQAMRQLMQWMVDKIRAT